jgi:chromosome segregation ATPase
MNVVSNKVNKVYRVEPRVKTQDNECSHCAEKKKELSRLHTLINHKNRQLNNLKESKFGMGLERIEKLDTEIDSLTAKSLDLQTELKSARKKLKEAESKIQKLVTIRSEVDPTIKTYKDLLESL